MPTSHTSPKRRILVVDDSVLNREMLTDFIELLGHDVSVAEDGAQGLASIMAAPPDVVLLDLDMPVMTGMEVLERLAVHDDLRHIPVIVISGRDDMAHVVSALALGATDFLGKPFNPPLLEARLKSSIEKKDLRDRERALLHSLEKSYSDLKAAEESRDALTHMIVHDLGNPLSVISMNAEMLQMMGASRESLPTRDVLERLRHVADSAGTMDAMIRTILDVSKLESDQMPVHLEAVPLTQPVAHAALRHEQAAKEKGVALESSRVPEGLICRMDVQLFERILNNLISNALRYAEGATKIEIFADQDGQMAGLSVRDDGRGIPEGLHDRVFDKFYQVDSGQRNTRTGTGLGLAFCKLAVTAMGGSIAARPVHPRGTCFRLTLPLAETLVDSGESGATP